MKRRSWGSIYPGYLQHSGGNNISFISMEKASLLTIIFRHCVIRAPVPWHQSFVRSSQYCRHNLFITHPILIRIQACISHFNQLRKEFLHEPNFQMIWFKRFEHLRFVSTSGLGSAANNKSAPPSPQEMQKRIFEQCSRARTILEKAS